MFIRKCSLLLAAAFAATAFAGPVSDYGRLYVSSGKIVAEKSGGKPVQLKGPSFHWSAGMLGGYPNTDIDFYRTETVNALVDGWKASVIRVPLGIDYDTHDVADGYITKPAENWARVKTVVDAAIAKGVYVVVDWHSHSAHQTSEKAKAIEFFTSNDLAGQYGNNPAVIFEIYNEPLDNVTWSNIKGYANDVIKAIRDKGFKNLILVGTRCWSAEIGEAANDPPTDSENNFALVFHFYADGHRRDYAPWCGNSSTTYGSAITTAMNKGVAVFISEWGSNNADPENEQNPGGITSNPNAQAVAEWTTFMDQHKISGCAWAVADGDIYSKLDYWTEAGSPLKSANGNINNVSTWTNKGNMTTHGKIVYEWMTTNPLGPPDTPIDPPKPCTPGADCPNLVKDGDFPGSSLTSNWAITNADNGAAATASVSGGKVTVNITSVGAEVYQPQLVQTGITPLEAGKTYTLSFKASAVEARTFSVVLENSTFTTKYVDQTFNLTTGEQTFTHTFTMTATDNAAQLAFNFGGAGASTANVTISDVKLVQGGMTSIRAQFAVGATAPGRPSVTVKGRMLNVSSPNNSELTIRMIDVRGKTVARFNVGAITNRPHTFSLTSIPAGRYFVEVRGAGVKQTLPVVVK